jgi:hypothetical protein
LLPFNLNLILMPKSPKWFPPIRFQNQNSLRISYLPICAFPCPMLLRACSFSWFCVTSECCLHNLLHNCIHTEGWKPCANRGPVCTLENFQWCEEPYFATAAILRGRCLPLSPSRTSKVITDRISALWRVSLMLALQRTLLNRYKVLTNVL